MNTKGQYSKESRLAALGASVLTAKFSPDYAESVGELTYVEAVRQWLPLAAYCGS